MPSLSTIRLYTEAIICAIASLADHLNLPARAMENMPLITQIALGILIWIAVSLVIWIYPKVLYDALQLRRK